MTIQRRNATEKMRCLARRLWMAERLARGVRGCTALAAAYNAEHPDTPITRGMAWKDMARIREMWTEQAVAFITTATAEELAKLEAIEVEMWAAWEKSKRVERKRMSKKTTPADADAPGPAELAEQTLSIESEDTPGDERYMARIAWCMERRAKLLGLDAPSVAEIHLPGTVEQEKPVSVHDVRRAMLNDPQYLDYLRANAVASDARPVRPSAEQGQLVDLRSTPASPGS